MHPLTTAGSKPGQGGFTLMEVLVAMTIVAIVLVSVFRMQSGSADLAAAQRFHTTAAQLALKQMAAVESSNFEMDGESGDFSPSFPGFHWRAGIEDLSFKGMDMLPENDTGSMKKISLAVTEPVSGRTFKLTSLRYVHED